MDNNNGVMALKNDVANFTNDYKGIGRGLDILNPALDKFLKAVNDEQSIIADVEMYSDILQTIARNMTSKHENETNSSRAALAEAVKKLDGILGVLGECESDISNIPQQLSDYVQRFKAIIDEHSSNIHSAINLSRPLLSGFVDTNSDLVNMVPEDHSLDGAIKVDSIEPVKQGQNEVKAATNDNMEKELEGLLKHEIPQNKNNIDVLTKAAKDNAASDSVPDASVAYAPISFDDLDFNTTAAPGTKSVDNANDELDIDALLNQNEPVHPLKNIDNEYILVDSVEEYSKDNNKTGTPTDDNGYSRVLKN